MSGKVFVIALLAFAAVFGVGLWYAQQYAFYETVEGVEAVEIAGRSVQVSDFRGIDAQTSPLKLRSCFRLDPESVANAPEAEDPTPLVAPGWFECFDAAAIGEALERGEARAVLAADEGERVSRVVAVFPDGSAYQWRQIEAE